MSNIIVGKARIVAWTLLLAGVFLAVETASAQGPEDTGGKGDEWVRVETGDGALSLAMPGDIFVVRDTMGFSQRHPKRRDHIVEYTNLVSARSYEAGILYYVEKYEVRNTDLGLELLLYRYPGGSVKSFESNGVKGRVIEFGSDSRRMIFIFGTTDRIYLVGIGARDITDPRLKRFVGSILIKGERIFEAESDLIASDLKSYNLEEMTETPVEVVPMQRPSRKKDRNDQITTTKEETETAEKNKTEDENTKPLVIIEHIRAGYTEQARFRSEQGRVILRVTFKENGHVGRIEVLRQLRYGLLESSIRAAKLMKFVPMETGSGPIEVTRAVEYVFTIY